MWGLKVGALDTTQVVPQSKRVSTIQTPRATFRLPTFISTMDVPTEVDNWILQNDAGLRLRILAYGAVLQSLEVPVGGILRDVVLGLSTEADYSHSMEQPQPPYYGAIVGPHAGRLALGRWPGSSNTLEANDGPHHLHGASASLSRRRWVPIGKASQTSVTLGCRVESGEAGYPGKLDAQVTYKLEGTQMLICMEAQCVVPMPVNLTQHSYFDLTGRQGGAKQHQLRIASTEALETVGMIPTGRRVPVPPGPLALPHGMDQTFILESERNAILEVPDLRMTAATNQPCFHVFVGGPNGSDLLGKHGQPYRRGTGICLENQGYPDAPNHPDFQTTLLESGQAYINWISLTFEDLSR